MNISCAWVRVRLVFVLLVFEQQVSDLHLLLSSTCIVILNCFLFALKMICPISVDFLKINLSQQTNKCIFCDLHIADNCPGYFKGSESCRARL